jgi:hypothetical protein
MSVLSADWAGTLAEIREIEAGGVLLFGNGIVELAEVHQ